MGVAYLIFFLKSCKHFQSAYVFTNSSSSDPASLHHSPAFDVITAAEYSDMYAVMTECWCLMVGGMEAHSKMFGSFLTKNQVQTPIYVKKKLFKLRYRGTYHFLLRNFAKHFQVPMPFPPTMYE